MKKYDPDHAPNPAEWLRLDEQLRIALCAEHHRRTVDDDPANIQAHAAFHAIVENQIAENYEPAVRAAARLAGEGLTRHEAIHAIASVLVEYLYEASKLSEKQAIEVMKVDYRAALEWLIKDRWLDG